MTPPWVQKSRTPKSGGRGAGSRNGSTQSTRSTGGLVRRFTQHLAKFVATCPPAGNGANPKPSAVTHHHSLVSRAGLGAPVGGGLVGSTSRRGLGQLATGLRDCDCRGYTNMVLAGGGCQPGNGGVCSNLFLANLGGALEVPPAAVSRRPPPSATPLPAPCGEMRPRLHRCRWSR